MDITYVYVVDGVLYFETTEVLGCMVVRTYTSISTLLWMNTTTQYLLAMHFSANKLLGKLKRFYYWQRVRQDVHQKCSSCVVCASV